MFGKKKKTHLELKMDAGYYRLIVDYFDAKDKDKVRALLYGYLGDTYGEILLQADSNFVNKKMDGKEGEWMESLIRWGQSAAMPVESLKFKRQVTTSILGSMMGSKETKPGYRVGLIMEPKHVPEAVRLHQEIGMGLHLGCGIPEENRETILKAFCGGQIDEFNFERYYTVDFYDYDMISRCVMRSLNAEPLEAAKQALEAALI